MREDADAPVAEGADAVPEVRDSDGNLAHGFREAIRAAIEARDVDRLRALTGDLHEADMGDLIEELDGDERRRLIEMLGSAFDFTALTELDETVRVGILRGLSPLTIARGMRDLASDDAVYILEDLDEEEMAAVLEHLPAPERVALRRSLDYPEDSAGRRMQTDFIAVPPFWTVGRTIDYMRETPDLPETFYEVFVVDPAYRLVGSVSLDRLLRTRRTMLVTQVKTEHLKGVKATDDQEDVARLFERYNLVSAPVVDDAGRLVGVMTIDDVVDVIQEEADEDLRALAGVGSDEELSDSVAYTARSRLPWLVVNLGTAFISASIIGLFEATIEKMVALAVLMPIVASMGGNAGTQTMTVAVRALATKELSSHNARRIVSREVLVGLFNGLALACLLGLIAGAWFANAQLGAVIASALVMNMMAAGLFGILIPLAISWLKLDPAVASGVFVTTVTDTVGFFAFLGLATWWFGA
ncbi:UNVERIFIED_ORG: magnesium transporter [Xanthobacter viscosus]|jgi:magnesium transporter|uniref:Magnesium transporter MgtE n=1 Tax=Xanthobacter autotrophicus TaxID=280 RepID=A0A6C1KI80_XANAU|nr:magnesium transporter [Xanthobacter autotrophicus]TLX44002.1 magnesium transporter [Xanthobacter autotrophicus]